MEIWKKPRIYAIDSKTTQREIQVKSKSYISPAGIRITEESVRVLESAGLGESFWVFDLSGNPWQCIIEFIEISYLIIGVFFYGFGLFIWDCLSGLFKMA